MAISTPIHIYEVETFINCIDSSTPTAPRSTAMARPSTRRRKVAEQSIDSDRDAVETPAPREAKRPRKATAKQAQLSKFNFCVYFSHSHIICVDEEALEKEMVLETRKKVQEKKVAIAAVREQFAEESQAAQDEQQSQIAPPVQGSTHIDVESEDEDVQHRQELIRAMNSGMTGPVSLMFG